jgi:hypothetical protein
MRRLLTAALIFASAIGANAQRMHSASSHFAPRFHREEFPRPSFFPLAFSDPFYADYFSSTGYPVASQPPVIVMQTSPPAAPAPPSFPSSAPPLMIELQGDHYVHVTEPDTSDVEVIAAEKLDRQTPNQGLGSARTPRDHRPTNTGVAAELAPATLVFRDGHREEASEYTIADGVLYTRADYYTEGSWNRKIELSALNLPETVKLNQSRGIRFQLPSSPNEVIVRP